MAHIQAQSRPHYPPTERLAILELRAARAWSLAQTASRLLVTPATVAAWMGRLDEGGPDALVQIAQPVNRFPEFVGYLVRRLKVLCPAMGRVRIARILARAGLHLGPTTVRRMLRAPRHCPEAERPPASAHHHAQARRLEAVHVPSRPRSQLHSSVLPGRRATSTDKPRATSDPGESPLPRIHDVGRPLSTAILGEPRRSLSVDNYTYGLNIFVAVSSAIHLSRFSGANDGVFAT